MVGRLEKVAGVGCGRRWRRWQRVRRRRVRRIVLVALAGEERGIFPGMLDSFHGAAGEATGIRVCPARTPRRR